MLSSGDGADTPTASSVFDTQTDTPTDALPDISASSVASSLEAPLSVAWNDVEPTALPILRTFPTVNVGVPILPLVVH